MKTYLIPLLILLVLANCGKAPVDIDENQYIEKIVVDGYLIPGFTARDIRIMRNYALNKKIDLSQILLTDANVSLLDLESNINYALQYSPLNFSFQYPGDELIIEHGKSYQLSVEAMIDGKNLFTTSTTRVPKAGFRIDEQSSLLGIKTYRQKNAAGELERFTITFHRSPDTDSYMTSLVALDASKENFIEDNSFGFKKEDLEDDIFRELSHQWLWNQTKLGKGIDKIEVEWFNIWFYGRYRVIVYAADKNFTDYTLTHRQVQEIDGNLLEPKFHFQGDGVGVFGAADPDTVFFEVSRDTPPGQ